MSRDGSKAKAQPQHASRMPSAIQARACLRDLCHAAMHTIIIPPRRDPEARRNLSRREQCANCRPTAGFSPLGVNLLTEPSRDRDGAPLLRPMASRGRPGFIGCGKTHVLYEGTTLQAAEKFAERRARLQRCRRVCDRRGPSGAKALITVA